MTTPQQGRWPDPRSVPPVPGGRRPTGPDDCSMAVVAHASGLVTMVISAGSLPFLGPVLLWALYRDRSPSVGQAAAGAFTVNVALWVLGMAGHPCVRHRRRVARRPGTAG